MTAADRALPPWLDYDLPLPARLRAAADGEWRVPVSASKALMLEAAEALEGEKDE